MLFVLISRIVWFDVITATQHAMGQVCFVCVEILRPSQPNGVMSSAVSLPYHAFMGTSVYLTTRLLDSLSPLSG